MGDGIGVAKYSRLRKKFDEAEWEIRLQKQTKTVNQKPVKIRKDVCLTSGDLVDDEVQ